MSRSAVRIVTFVLASVSLVVLGTSNEGSAEAASRGEEGPTGPPRNDRLASIAPKTSVTTPIAATGGCAENMTEIEGDYCPWVEQQCLRWLDPETKMRCAEFAPTQCATRTVRKHFCIDRFEYPNRPGDKPQIFVTWHQAQSACAGQGRRLCGDSEWTLACEGQERLPYPYGYARNADACNIDRPYLSPDERAIGNQTTRDAELARLDQRELSGSRDSCVSPYGVHDMTGNVDEWVVNESGHPYKSGLKGGYWGPVRTRCRPMTTAHDENFAFYQVGFRCCSDAPSAPATTEHGVKGTPSAAVAPPRGTLLAGS
jgi:hypothetical protein